MSTGYAIIDSAVEASNFSLALKLIDKKLSQQPNSSYNHACRCFILANSALNPESKTSVDDALKESLELSNKIPSDPNTLALLETTFELLNYKPKDDLYEAAIRKYQSHNLAYEWFRKTVDKNDIIGMQKATMALSKAFKPNTENGRMIKLWSAAVIVVLISCCKEPTRLGTGKDKLLAMLGSKIVETVESESKKGLNAQEMYVKCELLLKKGDTTKCLDELKKFLLKESDLELRLIYFEQLKKNEMWDELYNSCVEYLVTVGVDDWDTWKLAIQASKKLGNTDDITKIINSYEIGRNTQLAKIEVLDTPDIEGKKKALINYLDLYMNKLCCFLDLQNFLENKILSNQIILSILEKKYAEFDIPSIIAGTKKANEKDLVILVNYIKIKTLLSPDLFKDPNFFGDCCKYFDVTKHLQNKLAEFDYYAGFEFLILAIESYLTINENKINTQIYFNIIIVLENSLIRNKYEFHLQLWLAHFYSNTNLSSPLNRIFETLKIKNLQIDTLSTHFTNHISTKTHNNDIISTAYKFYSHNVANELPPMIMSCFEQSTFSKLRGFIEFKIRVENSVAHYYTILQTIQNIRLSKDFNSIDDISRNYIPKLRNAYNIMLHNGDDVDLKIHDNSDRKILWACGDHTLHKVPQKFVESKFSCLVDVKYIELLVLYQLIIYDQHSHAWNDYRNKFLSIIENIDDINALSNVEKSIILIFKNIIMDGTEFSEPIVENEPTDPLSAEFNNYYLSLQDFEKVLTTILKQCSTSSFFGKKEKRSQITKIHNHFKNICKDFKRDDILIRTKECLSKYKNNSQEWFANDEFGKQFKISSDIINACYKNINLDALKAVKEI